MDDELGRDGRRERPGPHALQPPRGHPQGDRAASATCPIWIGPWEASAIAMQLQGLTPERPLTHDLFASALEAIGAPGRPGRHLRARRGDVPRPAAPRARRQDGRGRRPAVGRAGPRGPGRRPDLRLEAVLEQAALGADSALGDEEGERAGSPSSRPARGSSTRASTSSATSSTRSTPTRRPRAASS